MVDGQAGAIFQRTAGYGLRTPSGVESAVHEPDIRSFARSDCATTQPGTVPLLLAGAIHARS
jgi:hypothetical protein